MNRRNFIKTLSTGVTFGGLANVIASEKPEEKFGFLSIEKTIQKLKKSQTEKIELIKGAEYLQGKDIEYIAKSSMKVLSKKSKFSKGFSQLNIPYPTFQKIVTNDPAFSIPLVSEVVKDLLGKQKTISILGTIGEKKKGLWYGEESTPEKSRDSPIALPHVTINDLMLYVEFKKQGTQGRLVSYSNHKENNCGGVDINTYCFLDLKGKNIFTKSLVKIIGSSPANNARDKIMKLLETPNDLIKNLTPDKIKEISISRNYSTEKINYLKNLL